MKLLNRLYLLGQFMLFINYCNIINCIILEQTLQELLTLADHTSLPSILVSFCLSIILYSVYYMFFLTIVGFFVPILLTIVLYVLLQFSASNYSFWNLQTFPFLANIHNFDQYLLDKKKSKDLIYCLVNGILLFLFSLMVLHCRSYRH